MLDRADSPGGYPPLAAEVGAALAGSPALVQSYVYGLGGRELHPEDVHAVFRDERRTARVRYLGLRGAPCRV